MKKTGKLWILHVALAVFIAFVMTTCATSGGRRGEASGEPKLKLIFGNLFNEGDYAVSSSFKAAKWEHSGSLTLAEGRGANEDALMLDGFIGYKKVDLAPGQTYKVRVFARNSARGALDGPQRPKSGEDADTRKNKLSFQYDSPREDAQGYTKDRYNMYVTSDEWAWYEMTFTTPSDMTDPNLVFAMRASICYIEQLTVENAEGKNIFNGGSAEMATIGLNTWNGVYAESEMGSHKDTEALLAPKGASGTSALPLGGGRTYDVWVLARAEEAAEGNRVSLIHGGGRLLDIKVADPSWKWYKGTITTPADLSGAKMELSAGGSDTLLEAVVVLDRDPPPLPVVVLGNRNKTFQTIDGFGFFGPRRPWWSGSNAGIYYTADWIDRALIDMGLTMWRNDVYAYIPPTSSNARDAFGQQDNSWNVMQPMVKALYNRAKELDIPLKIILTAWSPPGQWKDNQNTRDGGKLLPQFYADYGNWWVQVLDMYKAGGIDVYAISLQNEPAFKTFYNSMDITAEEYVGMLKGAGPIIKAKYPNVKIFGSENMLQFENEPWGVHFHDAIIADPQAYALLDVFAVHGYSDGVNPVGIENHRIFWEAEKAKSNKPLWMTETSGYDGNIWLDKGESLGILNVANALHMALVYGDMSGWVWWYMEENSAASKLFNVLKQFYAFIRPGAVRVDASIPDEKINLKVSAYKDDAKGTTTIVLVNTSGQKYSTDVSSLGALEYEYYITDGGVGVNCQSKGTVSSKDVFVPAYSVVTLFNGPSPFPSKGRRR
jgi:O-glycosyl hydrolase